MAQNIYAIFPTYNAHAIRDRYAPVVMNSIGHATLSLIARHLDRRIILIGDPLPQPNKRHPAHLLIAWIDLKTRRYQRCSPQQWLRVLVTHQNRRAYHLSH